MRKYADHLWICAIINANYAMPFVMVWSFVIECVCVCVFELWTRIVSDLKWIVRFLLLWNTIRFPSVNSLPDRKLPKSYKFFPSQKNQWKFTLFFVILLSTSTNDILEYFENSMDPLILRVFKHCFVLCSFIYSLGQKKCTPKNQENYGQRVTGFVLVS